MRNIHCLFGQFVLVWCKIALFILCAAQKERSWAKCKREKHRLEQEVDELEKKVERMNTIKSQVNIT